jgi:hypothetical protein
VALLVLRPTAVLDVIDGAFQLVRSNVKALAPQLLLVALPFEVLIYYADRHSSLFAPLFGQVGIAIGVFTTGSGASVGLWALGAGGLILVAPLLAANVCRTVAARYLGDQGVNAPKTPVVALVVAGALCHLVEFVAFPFWYLPGLAFGSLFFLTVPAIVIEGLGPFRAMGRSWSLVGRQFLRAVGMALGGAALIYLAARIVSSVPFALASLAPTAVTVLLNTVIGTVVQACEWASLAALATLIYLDQRARQEGLDLEVMAARAR